MVDTLTDIFERIARIYGLTAQFAFTLLLITHIAITWCFAAVLIPLFALVAIAIVVGVVQIILLGLWSLIT